ncbi:TrmH family RNA methyltransferase [Phenylobacterium sp.]|uniref:TrmH family RNA methyltransferase n=1 Tax=Phenylobacterium sp. TaxID=1871053 RepID=UPI0037CBB9D2
MAIISIQTADDPRLEPYRQVRERDLVGRDGLFIAEGRVVLEKLIGARPDRIDSLLVAAHRLESLADLLAGVPEATPVYAASQAAMDQVVGFPIHRGILAVGRKPQVDLARLLADLPADALVVGLVGIANHDNMGGILRNAAAFGVDAVLMDSGCCDPFYRKAIRVSVGAALTLPIAVGGTAEALVETLQAAGFEIHALSPAGSVSLDELAVGGRTAILFGAEGPGLPATILDRVQTVRIAMAGGFDSLNVATTSGIVLHRLSRSRRVRQTRSSVRPPPS